MHECPNKTLTALIVRDGELPLIDSSSEGGYTEIDAFGYKYLMELIFQTLNFSSSLLAVFLLP